MTDKEEKELIKRRACYKGRLTLFGNYLSNLDGSISQSQVNEIQLRMEKMSSIFEQYDEVQFKLECLADDMDTQLVERNEFETQYYKLVSHAQGIISRFSKTSHSDSNSEKSLSRANNKLVKLPTIQLPKFSGSYDNWLEFHDTFSSLIDSNEEIDNINKFHYLRASLEGSAAVVIQSIEFSSKNYKVAWELLCERFDNKRLLVQNHVSALFNIDPIIKESSSSIKRMIDQLNKNLRSLESLGEPTKQWDTLLIYIVTHKLDSKTYREWEEIKGQVDKNEPLTLDIFFKFLRGRADFLESLELSRNNNNSQFNQSKLNSKMKSMVTVTNYQQSDNNYKSLNSSTHKNCPKCKHDHQLKNCPQFLGLNNEQRLKLLPNYKICYNCLHIGHYANQCKKSGCKICKRKHNTLIHVTDSKSPATPASTSTSSDNSSSFLEQSPTSNITLAVSMNEAFNNSQEVLLSTALIKIYDAHQREYVIRALLDSGSTSCLIREHICNKLKLPVEFVEQSVVGINNFRLPIGNVCNIDICSLDNKYSKKVKCFVLPSLTGKIPSSKINISSLNLPSYINLADPNFHSPAEIDLIVGADIFWELLGSQIIKLGPGKPILCETKLGWLVSGPLYSGYVSNRSNPIKCNLAQISDHNSDGPNDDNKKVKEILERFWQLEEINDKPVYYTEEERMCEEHFINNTTRLADGRFCVKIPLKLDVSNLGDSLTRAKHCFLSLERRLNNQSWFKTKYLEFMSEYKILGHMSELESTSNFAYFIPHHGIRRDSSETTKLRVVFNASSPTTSGISLNEIQMVGPTIQNDLLAILIRFRFYKYILSADVEKMYRQIAVHPDDRHLQQIIWRDDESQPLKFYQLNTVTYGTASAPFLAIRCLKQIGLECKDKNISEIIVNDFYVDDLLTGADTKEDILVIQDKVTTALAAAQMTLRKWKSNLFDINIDGSKNCPLNLNMGDSCLSKTLGLGWQSSTDRIYFNIDKNISSVITKRSILSVTAQIFDPLGLLAPCVILMKCILQKIWLQKISWDEPLPSDITQSWCQSIKNLPYLNNLNIPRNVLIDFYEIVDLHIFCDASQYAYGACLYIRSVNSEGKVLVRLLMAKSRVAPIKPCTIPRLELCGALVALRLYEKAIKSLRINVRQSFFWTDSSIVLGWLKMLPSKLQPFVRNRIAEILEKTSNCIWRHVPTNKNPADYISRGIDAKTIQSLDIWWSGPSFLLGEMSTWPLNLTTPTSLPEIRSVIAVNVAINQFDNKIINFNNFSNLSRLKRTVAYIFHFINRCKKKSVKNYLQVHELNNALKFLVKLAQRDCFSEYDYLIKNKVLPKKSPLNKLNVFIDDDDLLRVGGRLDNSDFDFNKKYPILLSAKHPFTKLLFISKHKELLHAGPQLMLASIKETYWPLGGRNLAKQCYRNCMRCARLRAKVIAPIMGQLPQQRISVSYPFENVGIDYAGPFMIVSRQGRGSRLVKAYIAIFVCLSIKAMHIELVGDLTSNCFLLALRRFMSRRGKPKHIFCDNGTSFVGAYNEIGKFLKDNSLSLSETVAEEEIEFHFTPAYSPHFGGLWEAGVKSTKFHLQRVLGNCHLSYEELNTVLVQIEAILNSRPLTQLSSDPADLLPLTPGHFLIGRPFTSLPSPSYEDQKIHNLTRYQRIEQLRQHFWKRWSTEYISQFQERTKWQAKNHPLKLNSLALIKDENLPPLKWKLGRIIKLHPGPDGVARVADVKTTSGIVRRSFSKICILPNPQDC